MIGASQNFAWTALTWTQNKLSDMNKIFTKFKCIGINRSDIRSKPKEKGNVCLEQSIALYIDPKGRI